MTTLTPEVLAARGRIIRAVEEAERAFANRPKALWSGRPYLSPQFARDCRAALTTPSDTERSA